MVEKDSGRWSRIERELAITANDAPDTHVSLVLNEPDEHAATVDYDWHSILTEYLDDSERSELITGVRDAGFAATVYDGERAFLTAVLTGEWQAIPSSIKYVFSTTGSGVGRARTSLIPAFCDLSQIPRCSADGLTAGLLENKYYTFKLMGALEFPIPDTWLYHPIHGWLDGSPNDDKIIICKPCLECSSIGVDNRSIFRYHMDKIAFLREMAQSFKQPILVQEFIPGYEVEVPIFPCPDPISPAAIGIQLEGRKLLGSAILTNSRIIAGSYDFFDFAELDVAKADILKASAERLYVALGFSGLVRVDFRVTPTGRVCIMDVNTPPHLTDHSSCRFAFGLAGLRHADLMTMLVTVGRLGKQV